MHQERQRWVTHYCRSRDCLYDATRVTEVVQVVVPAVIQRRYYYFHLLSQNLLYRVIQLVYLRLADFNSFLTHFFYYFHIFYVYLSSTSSLKFVIYFE